MITQRQFADDTRGVAPLIAFILLFGISIVAFAGYQATVVPDQNAETEFQHYENVRDDMIDVRSGVLQAHSGTDQFKSVQLGTQYRSRILAANPPPATGDLLTTSPYPLKIKSVEDDNTIETYPSRFLTYSSNHNELQTGSLVYENTLLYLDARPDGGGIAPQTSSRLADDDSITLPILQNDFRQSGTQRTNVDLRGQVEDDLSVDDDPIELVIPTALDQATWEDQLDDVDGISFRFEGSPAELPDDLNQLHIFVDDPSETDIDLSLIGVDGLPTDTADDIVREPIPVLEGPVQQTDPMVQEQEVDITDRDETFEQTYRFSLTDDLREGDQITIRLDDPIQEGGFEYPDAVEINEGEGSAEITDDGTTITYLISADDDPNDDIEIDTDGDIETVDGSSPGIYTVSFEDESDQTLEPSFVAFDQEDDTNIEFTDLIFSNPERQEFISFADRGSNVEIGEEQRDDLELEVRVGNSGGQLDGGSVELQIDGDTERTQEDVDFESGIESFSFDDDETFNDLDPGEYTITAVAIDGEGNERDQIEGTLSITDRNPQFTKLSAEVTDYNKGQGVIRQVDVDGTVDFFDGEGFVEIEIEGDNPDEIDDPTRSTEVDAGDDFGDFNFEVGGGNDGQEEVDVTARLFDEDGGDLLQECVATRPLLADEDSISLENGDFDCEPPGL